MANTCIVVIGLPRSGTSATAGALHKAGVLMQRKSMGRNAFNPRGYYEDLRWKETNKTWVGGSNHYRLHIPDGTVPDNIARRYHKLAKQYQQARLWGMKDPRLCITARYIWPLLDDVRLVAVHRDFNATVRSLWSHSYAARKGKPKLRREENEIRELLKIWRAQRDETLALWNGPRIDVRYEELLSDPHGQMARLCKFAARSTGVELHPGKGAAFIDPKLNHGGRHPKARKLFGGQD